MRYLLVLMMSTFALHAGNSAYEMLKHYKNNSYAKACTMGSKIYSKIKKDEKLLSIYGVSCIYADKIDEALKPAEALRKSKNGRSNATSFINLAFKKKLLIHALVDGVSIEGLKLPTTKHIVSKVFDLFVAGKYKKSSDIYILIDETDKDLSYIVSLEQKAGIFSLIIKEYYESKLLKEHRYR